MRELIYSVAGVETKSYKMAQEIAQMKNAKIESKVVEIKTTTGREGKYAGLTPIMKYNPPYKR
jgi:hypothetical protein